MPAHHMVLRIMLGFLLRLARFRTPCLLALLYGPLASSAQLAQSPFTTGTDGWLSATLPYPHALPLTVLNTFTPQWQPGDYIWLADPDGSQPSGGVQYWQAPAPFLGDKSAAERGRLSFDLRNQGSGYGAFTQEDVLLVGAGLTLVHSLSNAPSETTFTHFSAPLNPGAWRLGSLAGPLATGAQLRSVLAGLSQLFIRGEFQLGPDTAYLSDVTLCAGGKLSITGLPGKVLITWPQAACNAILLRSDALGDAASWIPEGTTPILMGNVFAVTNSADGPARFYRLILP